MQKISLCSFFVISLIGQNYLWSPVASAQDSPAPILRPAADATTPGATDVPAPQAKSPAASPKPHKSLKAADLPIGAVSVATAAFVGMPISLVRRTIWEDKQGVKGMVGDNPNKVAQVAAGIFWAPFSLALGIGSAPVYGPVNSLKNYDKPFSKEQFSLGDYGDGSGRDPK